MDKKELKFLIREALEISQEAYFQNIDSIGTKTSEAPSDEDDNSKDKSKGKSKAEEDIVKKIPFLESDEKKFAKDFEQVLQILNKAARLNLRNKKEFEEFSKKFAELNRQYNNIRNIALKDIRRDDKLSRQTMKKFEEISLKFKELFARKARKALKDKRILNWFQIK